MKECTTLKDAQKRLTLLLLPVRKETNDNKKVELIKQAVETIKQDADPSFYGDLAEHAKKFCSRWGLKHFANDAKLLFSSSVDVNVLFQSAEERIKNAASYRESIVRKSQVSRSILNEFFLENPLAAQNFLCSAEKGADFQMQGTTENDIIVPGFIDTFLANREGGSLVTRDHIRDNVLYLKQKLFEKVLSLMTDPAFFNKGKQLYFKETPQLFDEQGNYSGLLDPEKEWKDDNGIEVLPTIKYYFESLLKESNKLDDLYKLSYKTGKVAQNALKELEAYNAWVLLHNFDTILSLTMQDTVVLTDPTQFNRISNLSYNTNIDKATNMWGNGFGDEVENIADLVSNVTQKLVESSRVYGWKSTTPLRGQYMTFKDFNYIIGKIKELVFSQQAQNIKINIDEETIKWVNRKRVSVKQYDNLSLITKEVLASIQQFNIKKGNQDTTPTLGQVIALISENPSRYLHAIFDILCNSNILNSYDLNFNANDKSLLWSLHQEIFGNNTRSLFTLHHNTKNDKIFSIITQVSDSMFREDFIQYYEDENRIIFAQTLQDYAAKQLSDNIVSTIQQSNVSDFNMPRHCTAIQNMKNGESYIKYSSNRNILQDITNNKVYSIGKLPISTKVIEKISIPLNVNDKELFKLQITNSKVTIEQGKDYSNNGTIYKQLWESNEFQDLIYDTLGIDFRNNPDLKAAYENGFYTSQVDYTALVQDISKVLGTALFNAEVNTFIIPNYAVAIRTAGEQEKLADAKLNPTNIDYILNAQYESDSKPDVQQSTGQISIIPKKKRVYLLDKLSTAKATEYKVFSSSQVKTGEGTAVSQYNLSCQRQSYQYQLATQNDAADSSTKEMTFVKNKNGLFGKVITSRELKSKVETKESTKMNGTELWSISFYSDFVSAFCKEKHRPTSPVGAGWAAFISTVNSDKGKYDKIPANLKAQSHIKRNNVDFKQYIELEPTEIEQEIRIEFAPFFRKTIKNINAELNRVLNLLNIQIENVQQYNPLTYWQAALNAIQNHYGPKYSDAIKGLQKDLTAYNATHSRNPIQIGEQIHYVKGEDGRLGVNRVLAAQFVRFSAEENERRSIDVDSLYYRKGLAQDAANIIINYYANKSLEWREALRPYLKAKGFNIKHLSEFYGREENALLLYQYFTHFSKDSKITFPNKDPKYIELYNKFKDKVFAYALYQSQPIKQDKIDISNISTQDAINIVTTFIEKAQKKCKSINTDKAAVRIIDDIKSYFIKKQETFPDILDTFHLNPEKGVITFSEEDSEQYLNGNYTLYSIGMDIQILKEECRDLSGNEIPENVKIYNEVNKALYDLQASTIQGYFEKLDYESAIKLLKQNCEIYLEGVYARDQAETEELKKYKDFVTNDGKMAFFNVAIENSTTGEVTSLPTNDLFIIESARRSGRRVTVHPLIEKYNRFDFLITQQYAYCVGGATYVYKGKGDNALSEEASRWNASNKRNNSYTATIHKYENGLLNGAPRFLNYAIFEDIVTPLYNPMGQLHSHTPLDGCTIIDPFITILENNSLGGEAAGTDKKNYAVIYMEKYGVTATEKTASFAVTNERMRNSEWWRNVGENMCDRPWIKEYADSQGNDIREVLDITKDYNGEKINWEGQNIYFYDEEVGEDGISRVYFYRLVDVIPKGNNTYEIHKIRVDEYGSDISDEDFDQDLTKTVVIDTNWKLFTEIFGGYKSLYYPTDSIGNVDVNGKLVPTERSRYLMVDAMNQIGYHRIDANKYEAIDDKGNNIIAYAGRVQHIEDDYQYDQEDVWQPLKYSNVQHFNNIGAIKSAYCNVNPSSTLSTKSPLNTFRVKLAQSGIQLDKEHVADDAELSMPTQIITACANKGYVLKKTSNLYKALSTLTEIAIEDCMNGIMDIMPEGEHRGILQAKIAEIIIDKLINGSNDDEALSSALDFLIEKRKRGERILPEDVKGKVAWSDPTVYNKIFSDLASSLTTKAVKLKIAGSLSVICPSAGFERLVGNKRLSTLLELVPGGLGETAALLRYQQQLRNSDKVEERIYDIERDGNLSNTEKLSNLSHIQTQHIYHVEYTNPITGEPYIKTITINYPQQYYQLKQEVTKFTTIPAGSMQDSLAMTSASGEIIVPDTINPEYFLNYINGNATKDGKPLVASLQKQRVFEKLFEENFFTQETFKKMLSDAEGNWDPNRIKAFLLFHELSHKEHDDYKKYPKNILSDDAINIEIRATKDAATKLVEILQGGENAQKYIDEIALPSKIYEAVCKEEIQKDETTKIVPLCRELSAYNVQFKSEIIEDTNENIEGREFCLYDLDSIKCLFETVNDTIPEGPDTESIKEFGKNQFRNIETAETYIKSLPFYKEMKDQTKLLDLMLIELFRSDKEAAAVIRQHYNKLLEVKNSLLKDPNNPENLQAEEELYQSIIEKLHQDNIDGINLSAAAGKAYKTILEKDLRRKLQKDLLKLSSSYEGKRTVFCNGEEITVDGDSIIPIAYEVIMPKIFKTVFGLQENDDCQKIVEDKLFFVKRGIDKIKRATDDYYYDYALRAFSGNHTYILDANSEEGIPSGMRESSNFFKITQQDGSVYRVDINGEVMYQLYSADDKVMLTPMGVEVIVTNHPEFYIKNTSFNAFTFSNTRVSEEQLSSLANIIKNDPEHEENKAYNTLFTKKGTLRDFDALKQRNRDFENLSIEETDEPKTKNVQDILSDLYQEGIEIHNSFLKSLDVIAGRIPAQSQQSFMGQKVIAFTSSDINSAYVSTFQLFIQGSDLDIDTVNLIAASISKRGKYVLWSPYASLQSMEMIKESEQLPFPTGQAIEIKIQKNNQNGESPSFFEVYDKYFNYDPAHPLDSLFILEKDYKTGKIITDKAGVPKLKLNISTPLALRRLKTFLEEVSQKGITLTGNTDNRGNWKISENLFSEVYNGKDSAKLNNFKLFTELGIKPIHVFNIAEQLRDIVNKHNLYIRQANPKIRELMSKNVCFTEMFEIIMDPSNQTEAQDSVDISTKVVKGKGGAVEVALTYDDKYGISVNNETLQNCDPVSKCFALRTNQVGKQGVATGAKGVQAISMVQYAYNLLLNNPDFAHYVTITNSKTGEYGYKIGGKWRRIIANLYDKSQEADGQSKLDQKLQECLASSQEELINSVVQAAAMLSVAADNAKDLCLGKINATQEFFGMYVYGIMMGCDVPTLAKIINSTAGRALTYAVNGNSFSGIQGQKTALNAINFLKCIGIQKDLMQFDTKYGKQAQSLKFYRAVLREVAYFASQQGLDFKKEDYDPDDVTQFPNLLQYAYNQTKEGNSFLHNVVDSAIAYRNKAEGNTTPDIPERQLHSWLKKFANYSTQFKQDNSNMWDLQTLAQGASEIKLLGTFLGSNKGAKTKMNEGQDFINTFENLIISRYHDKGDYTKNTPDNKIDYNLFFTDQKYRWEVINKYESIKHSVNIPLVVALCPHIFSYMRTLMIPHIGFMDASSKYRSVQYAVGQEEYKDLGIFNQQDKANSMKKLNREINENMLLSYLAQTQKTFILPKECRYYDNEGNIKIASEDMPISLYTIQGLATFKMYMEDQIIPYYLKKDPAINTNKFIKDLQLISIGNTITYNNVFAYSLPVNMIPKVGSAEDTQLLDYKAAFRKMAAIKFPNTRSELPQGQSEIKNMQDAFYIYTEYVYGQKSPQSLMALFEDASCGLQKEFREYVAKFDTSRDFRLSEEELRKTAALPSNTFSPKFTYFYAKDQNNFGTTFYKKAGKKPRKGSEEWIEQQEQEEYLDNEGLQGNTKVTAIAQGNPLYSEDMKQHQMYPINPDESWKYTIQKVELCNNAFTVQYNGNKFTEITINSYPIKYDEGWDQERLTKEVTKIMNELNDNIDLCSQSYYTKSKVIIKVNNIDFVETALSMLLKKVKGEC